MGGLELKTIMVIQKEDPFMIKPLKTICRNGLPLLEVTDYLKEIQEAKSEQTLNSYTQHLFVFYSWLHESDIMLRDITPKVLKNYIKHLKNFNHNPDEMMDNKKKVLSENTIYQYGGTAIRFIEWCMSPSDQIKLLKKVKSGKIMRRGGMLRGIKNIVEISVLKDILPKTKDKLPEFLRGEQIVAIRKWITDTYEDYYDFPQRSLYLCAFEILIGSGVRKGELVSLQLDCLESEKVDGKVNYWLKLPFPNDLEEKYDKDLLRKIGVNLKTGFRRIPITSFTANAINSWKAKRPPEASHHSFLLANIHPDRQGHYFTTEVLRNLLNQMNNSDYGVGIEAHIYPHIFRHSYATEMTSLEVPLDTVQRLLGHASIESTLVYTHLDNAVVREHLEEKVWGHTKFFGGY